MKGIEGIAGGKAFLGFSITAGLLIAGKGLSDIGQALGAIEIIVLLLLTYGWICHIFEKRKILRVYPNKLDLPDHAKAITDKNYWGDAGRLALYTQIVGISAFLFKWYWLVIVCYVTSSLFFAADENKAKHDL